MRPKHDSLLIGIATGIVITVTGYFIAIGTNEWISTILDKPFAFKASTIALMAICLNMLSVGYFRRRYMHQSIRGILFFMMGLAMAWFFNYGQDLLNGNL